MQKIFKIERAQNSSEFKNTNQSQDKRRRKARMARKSRQSVDLDKMIAAQAKLHNEEKEMLYQQEAMLLATRQNLVKDEDNSSLKLLRSESTLTLDQETKDTINEGDGENFHHDTQPRIYVTSIDAAILECFDYIENVSVTLKQEQEKFHREKQKLLPDRTDSTPEYTLVLDLDETLVHGSISPFEGYHEIRECIYISYRPFLIEFLEKVSQLFEVVVFTASEKEYACMILDIIDPEHKYIKHRLYRESGLPLNGNYIKDLSILGRDINKTIIIDNSIIAFSLNIDNGIPIHSFCGNKYDEELYKLMQILDYAVGIGTEANQINLREYLTSMFGLKERITFWQSQYLAHSKHTVLPISTE